jgi:hypothetical protein
LRRCLQARGHSIPGGGAHPKCRGPFAVGEGPAVYDSTTNTTQEGLPVEPLADVTTTDNLQTPTARILHTKEAFRSRTLPTPHHSLRLSLLISSEPGGSTDICQQQRSTAVGTYMKSQTRASSRRHPLGPRCCTLVIAEWI